MQGNCFSCGQDGSNCAIMGYRANEHYSTFKGQMESNVKFYLDTGKSSPFCRMKKSSSLLNLKAYADYSLIIIALEFEHLLRVNLGKDSESENRLQGYLKVNLHGSKGELNGVDLTPE